MIVFIFIINTKYCNTYVMKSETVERLSITILAYSTKDKKTLNCQNNTEHLGIINRLTAIRPF